MYYLLTRVGLVEQSWRIPVLKDVWQIESFEVFKQEIECMLPASPVGPLNLDKLNIKKIMKLVQTHMNNLGLVDTFMSEINCSSNAQCSTNEVLKMYLCTHTVQHSVQEELCQCLWWKYPFTWICWKDWSYLIWEAPVLKWKRWKRVMGWVSVNLHFHPIIYTYKSTVADFYKCCTFHK